MRKDLLVGELRHLIGVTAKGIWSVSGSGNKETG